MRRKQSRTTKTKPKGTKTKATKGTTMSARAVPELRAAFGAHVRMLRQAKGLSQENVGALAGLSGKFQGEVERGAKSISLDSLYRVAQALGTDLATMVSVNVNGKRPKRSARRK